MRQGLVLLVLVAATLSLQATDDTCIVCGRYPVPPGAPHITYREQPWALCGTACAEVWLRAREEGRIDRVVRHLEPRGALFQGDAEFLNSDVFYGWSRSWMALALGSWLLASLFSGGIAAALAIRTHRSTPIAFMLGLVLPLLGVGLALCLPKKEAELDMRGSKVPSTRSPVPCPGCGAPCHPAAARCARCGGDLSPRVRSEVGIA